MNENDLQTHRNSESHRRTTLALACLFCNIVFTIPTEVPDHLLIGACPCAPALTRSVILPICQRSDPKDPITNQMIGYPQNTGAKCIVARRAFNGNSWEYYIYNKKFNSAQSLSQHLDSSVHQQKVYHCHNRNCGMKFAGLARLFVHLDSEACRMIRLKIVQQVQRGLGGARCGAGHAGLLADILVST